MLRHTLLTPSSLGTYLADPYRAHEAPVFYRSFADAETTLCSGPTATPPSNHYGAHDGHRKVLIHVVGYAANNAAICICLRRATVLDMIVYGANLQYGKLIGRLSDGRTSRWSWQPTSIYEDHGSLSNEETVVLMYGYMIRPVGQVTFASSIPTSPVLLCYNGRLLENISTRLETHQPLMRHKAAFGKCLDGSPKISCYASHKMLGRMRSVVWPAEHSKRGISFEFPIAPSAPSGYFKEAYA